MLIARSSAIYCKSVWSNSKLRLACMSTSQENYDGIPSPGYNREPGKLREKALNIFWLLQCCSIGNIHLQRNDHHCVEEDRNAEPQVFLEHFRFWNDHCTDNASSEHQQVTPYDEDRGVFLRATDHAKLEQHQRRGSNPVNVPDRGDLSSPEVSITHAHHLRQICQCRNGHDEEGHHLLCSRSTHPSIP